MTRERIVKLLSASVLLALPAFAAVATAPRRGQQPRPAAAQGQQQPAATPYQWPTPLPEKEWKALDERLFSAPDTPVRFEAQAEGGYRVCNLHKSASLRVYRFGCVRRVGDAWRVVETRERPYSDDLDPVDDGAIQCFGYRLADGSFPVEFCRGGKLAVVEAEFSDGSVWRLGDHLAAGRRPAR